VAIVIDANKSAVDRWVK